MNHRSPFSWIVNHFSYLQTYIFICCLFFISLLPIAYFWVKTHLEHIRLLDEQLQEIDEENVLINLFDELQEQRLVAQFFLSGNKESLSDLQNLAVQIRNTLQQAMMMKHGTKDNSTYEPSIWIRLDPRNIETRWTSLFHELSELTPDQSEALFTSIIHDLLIQFGYLSDKVGISYFREFENYTMIESVFLRLPLLQENLSELILLSINFLNNPERIFTYDRLKTLISMIESDLNYLKRGMDLHNTHFTDESHKELTQSLNSYRESVENIIEIIKQQFISKQTPTINLDQFQARAKAALKLGYQLWSKGLQDLKHIFEEEKAQIFFELWGVLLITFLLIGLAFLLGLALTLKGTLRLSQLTEATNSFTNGNLSIRVPVTYQDEIGRQGQAFNRMAQKLEEIIKHLYEVLDATTALAKGDLTARIKTHLEDKEFDQVAQSFNKMAETFETIISRLQQIGMMLMTSASEIASASKEQETIIVDQEATTREIAVAANEISSTAKEFASTMNEVNQVAEQTSILALKGKDSLTNMESIMRQMLEASSNIASKLAVLNEKAGNITGVITTITKVADQTNLLSLNASIEAEKAGEYGRSFAVIAREIRRLADQTAISTLDIEKIINEIMTAVSSSVMGVDDFTQEIRNGVEQVRTVSEQLAKIIEQVQAFTARFELVNQGMQAQSTGAEQINEAIAQLSQTAQQTSEAIHQFHRTIQELNNAANELRVLIIKSNLKTQDTSPPAHPQISPHSFEPTSKESTRQFNKTLSNLNIAANKLKNLNIQLRPPFEQDDEPPSANYQEND
jgi:methyl-accepting chemotaxis protein